MLCRCAANGNALRKFNETARDGAPSLYRRGHEQRHVPQLSSTILYRMNENARLAALGASGAIALDFDEILIFACLGLRATEVVAHH